MASGPKALELVPWDHDSPKHMQRMYDQRVACGWRFDETEKWQAMSRAGMKCLYWIVGFSSSAFIHFSDAPHAPPDSPLEGDTSSRLKPLNAALTHGPFLLYQEDSPIHDSATTFWLQPRSPPPSKQPFTPIGHIALDKRPSEFASLGLSRDGPIWIAGLYISWALQQYGIGKSAMLQAEKLAKSSPLDASLLVLDTMASEQQMSEEFIRRVYLDQGNPAPKGKRSLSLVECEDWAPTAITSLGSGEQAPLVLAVPVLDSHGVFFPIRLPPRKADTLIEHSRLDGVVGVAVACAIDSTPTGDGAEPLVLQDIIPPLPPL
ncbi:hypothetical protein MKZ38_000759 [Zalerion maritima]|uniref:Uncharacterized protein n=1 Tax=Zalerion maritima TaxID=339359 RepID=A0AAD5RR47_9PEZI|nr:hypothetical protein MKZ38_000759 [Zalerion maritima]